LSAKAKGWAVIQRGEIKVDTIAATRRAAIVNWLVTHIGRMVLNSHTDDDIEVMWRMSGGDLMALDVYPRAAEVYRDRGDTVLKSLWNNHRFLTSVSPAWWGNPQPGKAYKRAMVRRVFNSTSYKPLRSPRNRLRSAP
jgi:hypothetical protein